MEIIKANDGIDNLIEKAKKSGKYVIIIGYRDEYIRCHVGDWFNDKKSAIYCGRITCIRKVYRDVSFRESYNRYNIFIINRYTGNKYKLDLWQYPPYPIFMGSACIVTDDIYHERSYYVSDFREMLFFNSEEEMDLYINMNFKVKNKIERIKKIKRNRIQ